MWRVRRAVDGPLAVLAHVDELEALAALSTRLDVGDRALPDTRLGVAHDREESGAVLHRRASLAGGGI